MLIKTYQIIIKKSKFIGLLYEISTEDEAKSILSNLREEHSKARHLPYAYILGNTARKSDDKEPHNTAGMQIYNALLRSEYKSHLLVVVRYFGGTKLGAGNLLRTYAQCAKNTLLEK